MKTKRIATGKIRSLGIAAFRKTGVGKNEAAQVVDSLILTSLRGVDTHGVRLISHYVEAILLGRINPDPHMSFSRSLPAAGTLDADNGLGILAGYRAMNEAVSMGKKYGMGAVSVSHSTHFGAAGLYTIEAAKQNMIGFACTHVEALVLPFNGKQPFLGTNAVSMAVPCEDEDPIVLDMATTHMPLNKLAMFKAAGLRIPEGWAADRKGKLTTDPRRAMYLTHFGGYKGYGIAFMAEVLSSMLSGMPFGPHLQPMFPLNANRRNLGHFFSVINVEAFGKPSDVKGRMKTMVQELRSVPGVSGKKVQVPGDPEKSAFAKRAKSGTVPVSENDYQKLQNVFLKFGLIVGHL